MPRRRFKDTNKPSFDWILQRQTWRTWGWVGEKGGPGEYHRKRGWTWPCVPVPTDPREEEQEFTRTCEGCNKTFTIKEEWYFHRKVDCDYQKNQPGAWGEGRWHGSKKDRICWRCGKGGHYYALNQCFSEKTKDGIPITWGKPNRLESTSTLRMLGGLIELVGPGSPPTPMGGRGNERHTI